ncbi:MIP/aquaporin family protein [Rhodopila sp.]|uniref:MIP/aquaporin family protein n=1 Tax=Rhodopila sp. TaxID=2480087 RepID=UPI003D0B2353
MRLGKPLLAEFIGTFALVFIGAGAVTVLAPNETVAVALAHGFVIMTFAYAFGNDSRSYINPALAIAGLVAGEHAVADVIQVIVAQLLGGIAGAALLAFVYGAGAPHHLGATLIDLNRTTLLGGFILEAIGTFFLANTVLNTAIRGTAGRLAPFAIGMTVSFCIMAFGSVTGGSLNPARTLGPAVASGDYSELSIYLAAQVLGAVMAGLLYRFVWKEAAPQASGAAAESAADGL